MKHKVGFIGMGIMGVPMARNLLRAGHDVIVYNRTASRARILEKDGARVATTPAECAGERDVVVTMVTDGPDVEALLFGPAGAARGASPGCVFVDMSTTSPEFARSAAERLARSGFAFLDAPVSGGDIGAERGTLTIMVGGDAPAFERVKAVLEAMGKRITHMGPSGSGQATKACNQILCALNMLGTCEALAFGLENGLDLDRVHQVITGGAGNSWAFENLGRRIIDGDFRPGFMVRLLQKDLNIVLQAARRLALPLSGTALCHEYFRSCEAYGEGDLGTQAMFKVIERLGRLPPRGEKSDQQA